jgi:WhiB family redox-sensing transcriptional regulator
MGSLVNHEEWTDAALCAEVGGDAWFPEQGMLPTYAKSICAQCPVRLDCLAYALRTRQAYGVWGGLTERERRDLKPDFPREVGNTRCSNGHEYARFGRRDDGSCAECVRARRRRYDRNRKYWAS